MAAPSAPSLPAPALMCINPDDWLGTGPAGHVRRFTRAVTACAEFVAPFVSAAWGRRILTGVRRLLAFTALIAHIVS